MQNQIGIFYKAFELRDILQLLCPLHLYVAETIHLFLHGTHLYVLIFPTGTYKCMEEKRDVAVGIKKYVERHMIQITPITNTPKQIYNR